MPCGCQKKKGAAVLPQQVAARPPVTAARVAVYEVMVDGQMAVTTTSPRAAREEAGRLGGSVRVTSRPVEAGDPVPV